MNNKMAAEARLEKFFKREVHKRHGLALKFISPSVRGVPDQLVIHPEAGLFFVELKAPDGRPHPLQLVMHKKLEKYGARVYIVSSRAAVTELLDAIIGA